jgi:transcriptional regulator with XRE-family HTH domain
VTKIGANIKKIRKIKALSQASFADLFDISRGNISSYEESRAEPKIETVLRIANYFSIPLESLLTRDLTINEIVQFNADKLLEEEHKLTALKIKEVPLISDDIFIRAMHHEMSFVDTDQFPILKIPETSSFPLLALQFNSNITHHQHFEKYATNDTLFFRSVTLDNIHLIHKKMGLQLQPNNIVLGQFISDDNDVHFVLNQMHNEKVALDGVLQYWKLFASYQHIK